jgi:hypothetical protein
VGGTALGSVYVRCNTARSIRTLEHTALAIVVRDALLVSAALRRLGPLREPGGERVGAEAGEEVEGGGLSSWKAVATSSWSSLCNRPTSLRGKGLMQRGRGAGSV